MSGFLQRIMIVEQTATRLVLRELPLLDWIVMAGLFIVALTLTAYGLAISGLAALALGVLFAMRASARYIVFDEKEGTLSILRRGARGSRLAESFLLKNIQRVYLEVDQNGFSQIILTVAGEEYGLSVFSKDGRVWKEQIVVAINRFLNQRRERGEELPSSIM